MRIIRALLNSARMAGPVSEEKIATILAKEPIAEVKTRIDIPHYKTTVYFMGYGASENNNDSDTFQWKDVAIKLFHVWGSQNQPNLQFSHGNDNPKGFGHVALQVPDVYSFVKRIDPLGVKFIKKPDEGSPKGQAFIQDPDGYYIEVISEIVPVPDQKNPPLYDDMFKL